MPTGSCCFDTALDCKGKPQLRDFHNKICQKQALKCVTLKNYRLKGQIIVLILQENEWWVVGVKLQNYARRQRNVIIE